MSRHDCNGRIFFDERVASFVDCLVFKHKGEARQYNVRWHCLYGMTIKGKLHADGCKPSFMDTIMPKTPVFMWGLRHSDI